MIYQEIRSAVERDPHLSRLVQEAKNRQSNRPVYIKTSRISSFNRHFPSIIDCLSGCHLPQCEISGLLSLSHSYTSQVLGEMTYQGLICRTKVGRTYFYHLEGHEVGVLLHAMVEGVIERDKAMEYLLRLEPLVGMKFIEGRMADYLECRG